MFLHRTRSALAAWRRQAGLLYRAAQRGRCGYSNCLLQSSIRPRLCHIIKMKSNVILAVVAGALSLNIYARAWHDGNFTVTLSDTEGSPITNATVTVKTSKDILWGRGCDDEYNFILANSDTGGVASIDFKFCDPYFTWSLTTPTHYCQRYYTPNECFVFEADGDEYYNTIDTNTVEGLARYNEIFSVGEVDNYDSFTNFIAKFEPKSVTYTNRRIERFLKFYPKRNPQPMYAYGEKDWPDIPLTEATVEKDGYTLIVYPVVDFDLERLKAYVPTETNFGPRVDFRLERYYVETNGVANFYGRMVFAPGCGAYRCKQTGDASFPSCYVADTKAIFESHIDFCTIKDVSTGRRIASKRLAAEDEFVVMRTRMQTSLNGETNGWHYAKLLGPGRINGNLHFKQSVFNPRLNDTNLEFDMDHNLARPRYKVLCP